MMSCDMWHVTCDTWHLTPDTWHLTHDTQGVVNIVSKFQVPSSNSFGVIMFWRYFPPGSQSQLINAVCRTALATPGLLIVKIILVKDIGRLYGLRLQWADQTKNQKIPQVFGFGLHPLPPPFSKWSNRKQFFFRMASLSWTLFPSVDDFMWILVELNCLTRSLTQNQSPFSGWTVSTSLSSELYLII